MEATRAGVANQSETTVDQGWPTSQRLRAIFFTVLLQRATSSHQEPHTHGHTWTSPHPFLTQQRGTWLQLLSALSKWGSDPRWKTSDTSSWFYNHNREWMAAPGRVCLTLVLWKPLRSRMKPAKEPHEALEQGWQTQIHSGPTFKTWAKSRANTDINWKILPLTVNLFIWTQTSCNYIYNLILHTCKIEFQIKKYTSMAFIS